MESLWIPAVRNWTARSLAYFHLIILLLLQILVFGRSMNGERVISPSGWCNVQNDPFKGTGG